VAARDIYVDHASGAKASRPALDTVLRMLRDGDTLKITRLDRPGRSVLHLVTLGAELRERGVGLHVTEQGIDTTTAEGRAMFGMLSVLAEACQSKPAVIPRERSSAMAPKRFVLPTGRDYFVATSGMAATGIAGQCADRLPGPLTQPVQTPRSPRDAGLSEQRSASLSNAQAAGGDAAGV
jgi:hypothetical protein